MRKNSTKIKKRKLDESPVCYVCQDGTFYILELHHVIPIKSGGSDCDENTELLCPNCHAYFHFIISDRANDYFGKNMLVSDMIRCYKDSDIVAHRMLKLVNRWASGIESSAQIEERVVGK